MDDELEHSPQSWLDDFTQWFSWCRPSSRASPFLNNYFFTGSDDAADMSFENVLSDFFLIRKPTALPLLCCKPINIFIFVSHAIKFGDSFYPSRLQEKYIILCKPVLFFRVVRSSACKYLFIGIYPKENSVSKLYCSIYKTA